MKRLGYTGLVALANGLQAVFIGHPTLYKLLLTGRLAGLRHCLGVWRAWLNVKRAYCRVPAYRDFVDERGGPPVLRYRDGLPDLTVVPETDKVSYVQRYGHEARCVGGRLPRYGVMVDESSGSSGKPTSWVRGATERWVTKSMLQLSFRSALGEQPFFVVNAFALGAGSLGDRPERHPVAARHLHHEVDRAGHRQNRPHAGGVWARLRLRHHGLPAVPQDPVR
ncbi:MAG: hypothetical protein ACRDU8_01390 [Egibacteraceae bacterium]